jgi:inositol-pentakisphosphate 2-kinase
MQSRRKSVFLETVLEGSPAPASSDESSTAGEAAAGILKPAQSSPKITCCLARAHDDIVHDAVRFEFLNEGAANAVFRIRPSRPRVASSFVFLCNDMLVPREEMLGKILRVSKGKPKTLRSDEIVAGFEKEVRPLFRPGQPGIKMEERGIMLPGGRQDPSAIYPSTSFEQYLMDHELVYLSPFVLKVLHHEQHGPWNLPQVNLLEERGILLPDMSSEPGKSLTIELKPKWLAMSRNAPKDSYRCRTCAMHSWRVAFAKLPSPPYLCPLQLMAGNKQLIETVVRHKLRLHCEGHSDEIINTVTERAVKYLTMGPGALLLRHLRHLQVELDPRGVLWEPEKDDVELCLHRLRLAMTLRDCSLFLRIPYDDKHLSPIQVPIEAKLVDLDFKSVDKIHDWYRKEVSLISGGWYTNVKADVHQCLLAQGWKKHVPYWM